FEFETDGAPGVGARLGDILVVNLASACARAEPTVTPPAGVHPLATYLHALHQRHASCDEGQVASYIPELTKADPRWFGIAVATIDGHVYEVGDTQQP